MLCERSIESSKLSTGKSRMVNDKKLTKRLRSALQSRQGGEAPGFDAMWANAEKRYRESKSRYQRYAGVAAAAAIAVTLFLAWSTNGNNVAVAYLTEEDLMSSTHWLAPSDVLLPEHQFDIYGELPVLIETNNLDEGSLL